ncbi:MAG: hypothetical protein A2Z88_03020 [Omnitrophica WOR_2 bacterium GWA2_47_8]|nr:MAG: hypothetical protein A2Z88_03020 [Omnitrophica WOR_2 bacterium GWA2_47_8]
MRSNPFHIKRFQIKLAIVLIMAAVFALVLSNAVVYQFNLHERLESLRRELKVTAQTAALAVSAGDLAQIPLNESGLNSPQFQAIQTKLIQVKLSNPLIKYIYTMSTTATEGVWQFVVDADPFPESKRGETVRSFPGDKYNAARFPEMMKALNGPSADKKLEIDEWGATLSGYAPIRDSSGKAVAVIGVDADAKDVYSLYKTVRMRVGVTLLFGILLSVLAGILFSKRIHKPIGKLVEGTRRIAKGDLDYQVQVQGDDEISELGHSFNKMAQDLNLSRQRLVRYFYSIIRSLIKVLEARDEYTKGHSEKVARYAGKIALKMGLTRDQVGLFRKMTLLHDIGKVGIKDSILNKPDKLTPEEWEAIKKHPVIGEQILKPVLDNPDMLSVVRGHHERYDGSGYPDGLSKDQINIYAAIVSVADAYDAMTSDRAYRKGMSKEEAVAELKKHRGTQFNPKVVDTFLEVLKEEKI